VRAHCRVRRTFSIAVMCASFHVLACPCKSVWGRDCQPDGNANKGSTKASTALMYSLHSARSTGQRACHHGGRRATQAPTGPGTASATATASGNFHWQHSSAVTQHLHSSTHLIILDLSAFACLFSSLDNRR
jgi:hypothetical protein